MLSLSEPTFFSRLKKASRILIAGAGGGFDIYPGLPLAVALSAQGKQVHLANLSFANLDALDLADWIGQDVAGVHAGSACYEDYFPERALADWLGQHQVSRKPEPQPTRDGPGNAANTRPPHRTPRAQRSPPRPGSARGPTPGHRRPVPFPSSKGQLA